jgi:hypothetical protein
LANFDLPIPQPVWYQEPGTPGRLVRPNDVHIVIYGTFPWIAGAPDVVDTYQNGPWGKASSIVHVPWSNLDLPPTHPGYGYDQITVTYQGAELPGAGVQHFGVALRPCRLHVHVEIWWTYNGKRLWRMCPILHLWKIRVDGWWIVRVNNPTDRPIVMVQPRFFRVTTPRPQFPRIQQLVTDINPGDWGGVWSFFDVFTEVEIPENGAVTLRVPNSGDSPAPLVVQLRSRDFDSSDEVTLTDRNTDEFDSDTNGDGGVGIQDRATFGREYNLRSADLP